MTEAKDAFLLRDLMAQILQVLCESRRILSVTIKITTIRTGKNSVTISGCLYEETSSFAA